jgi:hypothetical protein
MSTPINLAPVQELLTNTADPQAIAQMLDEIAFDYACTLVVLKQSPQNTGPGAQAAEQLWLLHQLRNVFRACG